MGVDAHLQIKCSIAALAGIGRLYQIIAESFSHVDCHAIGMPAELLLGRSLHDAFK